MAWMLVPNLRDLRDQINRRFPRRDKSSDGAIGDRAHAASASSHNPDLTGNPEWRDGDHLDEVRALDLDADLRDEYGVTMEQVILHIITLARAGRLPHLRYVIYRGRIWHKRDGYRTRTYTGKNKHTGHCHINSDFTEAADTARVDWGIARLGIPERDEMTPEQESKILKGKLTSDNALFAWLRGIASGTMPTQTASGVDWSRMVPAPFPGLTQLGERLARVEQVIERIGERQPVELDYDRLAEALLRRIARQG